MKNCNAAENRTTSRILLTACATALALAFAVALPQPAYADEVTVPPVPANIAVPAGSEVFFVGHGVGTQNYVCLPSGSGVGFVLFTPEATLFSDDSKQITTHFFSPNPFENNANPAVSAVGPIRATWQHSRDTSTVWGQVKPGNSSSDPAFVAPDAIAWLLVTVVGADNGPAGGDALTETTFIQRLNTSGGVAPSTGCNSGTDVGHLAFVPYTADYFFYKAPERRADHGN
ncbi:MAG: DUF3455 domain-containing protein [Myxococcales bacterium]